MNIWMFNHYATSPAQPGGTRHFDLSKELVDQGHQVVIFASSFSHKKHKETRLDCEEKWKLEDIEGVKFVWIRTFPYQENDWRRILGMLIYMFRSWRLGKKLPTIRKDLGEPDTIVGSSVHLFAVFAAYQVTKHYDSKFIMEVRDLWPQTLVDMGKLSPHNPVTKVLAFLENFLYKRAEEIITLLPNANEYIENCGVAPGKITWIPNGVNLSYFNKYRQVNRNEKGDKDEFRVLYLGAHGKANALDQLIESAKILQNQGFSDIKFKLIGDGPQKKKLEERSRELGLANIEFNDPVPKKEVPFVLGGADVAIVILKDIELYQYGISLNKLFDYLAARKPVILAGNPVNNPVREANAGLTIQPGDPGKLAESIVKLYRISDEKLNLMGERGYNYVRDNYSMAILSEQLMNVVREPGGKI